MVGTSRGQAGCTPAQGLYLLSGLGRDHRLSWPKDSIFSSAVSGSVSRVFQHIRVQPSGTSWGLARSALVCSRCTASIQKREWLKPWDLSWFGSQGHTWLCWSHWGQRLSTTHMTLPWSLLEGCQQSASRYLPQLPCSLLLWVCSGGARQRGGWPEANGSTLSELPWWQPGA